MKNEPVRVHRFRDQVAIDIGEGQTHYISANQAEKLAETLLQFADDITDFKFGDSKVITMEIVP